MQVATYPPLLTSYSPVETPEQEDLDSLSVSELITLVGRKFCSCFEYNRNVAAELRALAKKNDLKGTRESAKKAFSSLTYAFGTRLIQDSPEASKVNELVIESLKKQAQKEDNSNALRKLKFLAEHTNFEVRKAALKALKEWIELTNALYTGDIFNTLAYSPHENVRSQAIANLKKLAGTPKNSLKALEELEKLAYSSERQVSIEAGKVWMEWVQSQSPELKKHAEQVVSRLI